MGRPYDVRVNVYDTFDKQYIANGATLHEAAKILGTSYQNVSRIKVNNLLFKKRYKLINLGNHIKPITEPEFDRYAWEWDFKQRWDEARLKLRRMH